MLNSGDKVFFSDTSELAREHVKAFLEIIRGLGLVPIFYEGLTLEGRDTKIAVEMRGDLYSAKVICFYLGGSTYEDNLALVEASDAVTKHGIDCLIFTAADFAPRTLSKYGISTPLEVVENSKMFAEKLSANLVALIKKSAH